MPLCNPKLSIALLHLKPPLQHKCSLGLRHIRVSISIIVCVVMCDIFAGNVSELRFDFYMHRSILHSFMSMWILIQVETFWVNHLLEKHGPQDKCCPGYDFSSHHTYPPLLILILQTSNFSPPTATWPLHTNGKYMGPSISCFRTRRMFSAIADHEADKCALSEPTPWSNSCIQVWNESIQWLQLDMLIALGTLDVQR